MKTDKNIVTNRLFGNRR